MHLRRRRLALLLGLSVLAGAIAAPMSVSARSVPADVAGAHVWNGQACDGTPLSVAYHVTDRGRAIFDSATGGNPRVRWAWRGFRVTFVGQGVRLTVRTHWRDGVLHLHEHVWQEPCPDPVPPTVPPGDGGNGQTG